MMKPTCTRSSLGIALAVVVFAASASAAAHEESAPEQESSTSSIDASGDEESAADSGDDSSDDEESAADSGDEADPVDDELPFELATDSIDGAQGAAQMRAEIESGEASAEQDGFVDDQLVDANEERVERMRAFFDRYEQEGKEPPKPLVQLREVGRQFSEVEHSYLQLQPVVPDPRWDEAMALVADDDCDEALKKATDILGPPDLHEDGEPFIAYAFARMQMCSSSGANQRSGRATMQELAELDSAAGRLAARSLGRRSNTVGDDDSLNVNAHIQAAKQRAAKGEVEEAIRDLIEFRAELDGAWERHQVRFAEASILEDAGQLDEAAMVYRAIYRKTSHWRSSDNIAARVERAEERLGREIITFGDRVDRMRALNARGRYRHAQQVSRENAQIRGVAGTEIRGWTRYRQGLQNERQRNRQRAVEQFEEADRLIEDPQVRSRMYFGWARALRRTGGDTEAIELYDRICEEYPGHHLCEQSLYEAGRLLQYRNRHEEARERFSALVGLYPFSEHVPHALWRYSLSAYLEDDFEAAIPPLKAVVEHHGEVQDRSELTSGLRARYWIGVNYLKLGDDVRAQHWLQNAIDHGAFTWYGLLAVTRLEDAGLGARIPRPTAQLTRDSIQDFSTLRIPHHSRLETAAALTRVGLYDEALREVRSLESLHPGPERLTPYRAALHLAVGEPNWAHWIMKSEIHERGPTHRTLRDWGFAFPLDYFELSHQYGEKFGVSPYLVHAIMRQESGFRPEVRSHAGAMGLMQLMPGTARYTSRTFFENQQLTNRQILDEETNVRLGTMYIRIHHAHAADSTPLALAGYNAGPGALRSWVERYGDRELDAWVESITYAETRGYVRKVMTSYITYQGLYGDGELPQINLQLPEQLGTWGEVPELEEEEPISMLLTTEFEDVTTPDSLATLGRPGLRKK